MFQSGPQDSSCSLRVQQLQTETQQLARNFSVFVTYCVSEPSLKHRFSHPYNTTPPTLRRQASLQSTVTPCLQHLVPHLPALPGPAQSHKSPPHPERQTQEQVCRATCSNFPCSTRHAFLQLESETCWEEAHILMNLGTVGIFTSRFKNLEVKIWACNRPLKFLLGGVLTSLPFISKHSRVLICKR
jgi:hypothetical protein